MTTELPVIFALRRYRPDITEKFPEFGPYKNLAVLINTNKAPDGSWTLNIINDPNLIVKESVIIKSYVDNWFNNGVSTLVVSNNNEMRPIKFMFNNYIISHSSGDIPLLKMSDPCVTLSQEFYYLNSDWCSSFRFEFTSLDTIKDVRSSGQLNINKMIEDTLARQEVCPVLMVDLCKENIRITSCGHAISVGVERWIDDKRTCPMCRHYQTLSELSRYSS